MSPTFFAFHNRAGRLLRAVSQTLVEGKPDLARILVTPAIPLEGLAPYRVAQGTPLYAQLAERARAGEVAWLFYPAKRDDLETVFSLHEGVWCVEKRVLRRCRRLLPTRFRQRALPREPLLQMPGHVPADRLREAATRGDWPTVEAELEAFLRGVRAAFPESQNGLLPEHALDAVPRNCLVDAAGRYRFFDLEYELLGGVPLSYLLYSTIKADIVSHLPKREREPRLAALYAEGCRRLGLVPALARDRKTARQLKAFNTRSPARLLTTLLMAFVPVRAWRQRLMWWDTAIAIRQLTAPATRKEDPCAS